MYKLPVGTEPQEERKAVVDFLSKFVGVDISARIIHTHRAHRTKDKPVIVVFRTIAEADQVHKLAQEKKMGDRIRRDFASHHLDVRAWFHYHQRILSAQGADVRVMRDFVLVDGAPHVLDFYNNLVPRDQLRGTRPPQQPREKQRPKGRMETEDSPMFERSYRDVVGGDSSLSQQ